MVKRGAPPKGGWLHEKSFWPVPGGLGGWSDIYSATKGTKLFAKTMQIFDEKLGRSIRVDTFASTSKKEITSYHRMLVKSSGAFHEVTMIRKNEGFYNFELRWNGRGSR
jgi:hypothetical protein